MHRTNYRYSTGTLYPVGTRCLQYYGPIHTLLIAMLINNNNQYFNHDARMCDATPTAATQFVGQFGGHHHHCKSYYDIRLEMSRYVQFESQSFIKE